MSKIKAEAITSKSMDNEQAQNTTADGLYKVEATRSQRHFRRAMNTEFTTVKGTSPTHMKKGLKGYPNRCNCRFNTMINRGVGRHHVLPTLESSRPVKLTITSRRLTQSRAQVYRHWE